MQPVYLIIPRGVSSPEDYSPDYCIPLQEHLIPRTAVKALENADKFGDFKPDVRPELVSLSRTYNTTTRATEFEALMPFFHGRNRSTEAGYRQFYMNFCCSVHPEDEKYEGVKIDAYFPTHNLEKLLKAINQRDGWEKRFVL